MLLLRAVDSRGLKMSIEPIKYRLVASRYYKKNIGSSSVRDIQHKLETFCPSET